MGKGLSLTFAECEDYDSDCEEEYERESKNYHKAVDFTIPLIITTCVISGLCIVRRKILIVFIINFLLIITKIVLFVYYIKYMLKSNGGEEQIDVLMILIISFEIIGNFLIILNEILK